MNLLKENELLNHIADLVDIENEHCYLNHGPGTNEKDYKAVDFLCQKFESDDGSEGFTIRIPICEECINGLYSNNWLLFYCIRCNESQWLDKNRSKNFYGYDTIKFMDICPKCNALSEKELFNKLT